MDTQFSLSLSEAVELGAVDGEFFARYFFPQTCRQASPKFEGKVWRLLDNPAARFVALKMFRGSAKTSRARIFTAKRIALGLSRTIIYTGKSQEHAARSVEWILKQVQFNRPFAETFGLQPGSKWTGTEAEILNVKSGVSTRIIALGITGSIRGVNVDDFRPDLIVGDDICDEENSATEEGRQKIEDLWFGALKESLAPVSECPDAKQVLLGTPINREDVLCKCAEDAQYKSLTVSILDEEEKSSWPERWTTETILADRQAAMNRNQLSLWLRENMCQLIARETCFFDAGRLKYYDLLPDDMTKVIIIDPVPPRDKPVDKQSLKTDFEVLTVMGCKAGQVYGLEQSANRGHTPEWTVTEFFRLVDRWRPRKVVVIAYAYERTLKWLLEKAMKARRRFVQVDNYLYMGEADRRSKVSRITEGLSGPLSNGVVWLPRSGFERTVEQIATYPTVNHDDEIETFAVGCELLLTDETLSEVDGSFIGLDEKDVEALPEWRDCP